MRLSLFATLLLTIAAGGGGYWLALQRAAPATPPPEPGMAHDGHVHAAAPPELAQKTLYQCPMHPWIQSDKPGQRCSICGMELVATEAGQHAGRHGAESTAQPDPAVVTLGPAQAAVVGVETSEIRRGPVTRTLRVNGVIDDDDTRHRILSARVPGRVEKLNVNYVGAEVKEGAPLATIYSPEMLTAQRQYMERLKAGAIATSASDRAAARERLLELGLTEEEVRILEGTQKPTAMVNVRAPMAGTVVSRNVYEGQYVEVNDRLFEVGDFSRMWLVFDAYEPDLAWLRVGQTVEVSVPSLPGQILTAPIAFIDPNLNEMTRTAKVRVVLENPERRILHRQTAQATVIGQSPETLLVPRSAVLQHRGKPVVYVQQGDGPSYRAKEVRLGRIGDREAEVLEGLAAGDRVVTQAALVLDSQAQLSHLAAGAGAHDHGAAPTRVAAGPKPHDRSADDLLKDLALAAADAASALAQDDLDAYRRVLPVLRKAEAAYMKGYASAADGPLKGLAAKLKDGPDLDQARAAFEPFSTAIADLVQEQHLHHREGITIFQCPMTPVLGTARWLSRNETLRNPFFGSAMPKCGDRVE